MTQSQIIAETETRTETATESSDISLSSEFAPLPESSFTAEEDIPEKALDEIGSAKSEGIRDYAQMAQEDLLALQDKFPLCRAMTHISQLQNPLRYAELRELGLSPEEAYLATNYARLSAYQKDNRSHLHSAIPKAAKGDGITADALSQARELFGNLSDGELISLYRRATASAK